MNLACGKFEVRTKGERYRCIDVCAVRSYNTGRWRFCRVDLPVAANQSIEKLHRLAESLYLYNHVCISRFRKVKKRRKDEGAKW